MSVTAFGDLPLAGRDREWDGDAAEKRVRRWADAQDNPNRSTATRTSGTTPTTRTISAPTSCLSDVVGRKLQAVPRAVMAASAVMQGSRGGVDLPKDDIPRVKSHLARYYKKMGDSAPWDRD